ncbi:DUF2279 domain-containing protein [Dyadobacter tibetensis]|uniref:DUF2279 domain-containing protein n=1 Tax=Dyadobacter tibetensis TaxID=1211851 RepID=UPI00046EADC2|nr:DUF2279 domain-containing protein [Dyadobacter tibetensis]
MEYLKRVGIVVMLVICCYGRAGAQTIPVQQDSSEHEPPNYRRLRAIFAGQSVLYAATLLGLSKAWYKNDLSQFRIKDDSREWLQMDKMGHMYTSYQIARHTAAIYKTSGISKRQMLVYGAISGIIFQTPIEILDGFSSDYGFSPGDMAANVAGSALYLGQMALWDEVRIHPKFSSHFTEYAQVRPNLLGQTPAERLLKDYNGQTYWFSGSPSSFIQHSGWPPWLCLSVGYGVSGMVSAETWRSREMGYNPTRTLYFSLDVDLTKIKTRSKFLKGLAFITNSIKVPAPALGFDKHGVRFKPFYF